MAEHDFCTSTFRNSTARNERVALPAPFHSASRVAAPINVGKTPGVDRRIGVVTGGRFEGERLRGTLLPGGSDWQVVRPGDGAWLLNVRMVLKTDDEHIVAMTYPGIRRCPKEVLDPHRPWRGCQRDRILHADYATLRNIVG